MSNGVPFEMPGVYVPGPDIVTVPAHYDPPVVTTNYATNPSFETAGAPIATRTNLVKKTRPTTTDFDGWATTGYGTGGVGVTTFVPDAGFNGLPAMVNTWTTAATAAGSTMFCARPSADDIPVVPGTIVTASLYMKSNQALTGVVSGLFTFYNSAGANVGSTLTAGRSVAANEEVRLTLTVTVPATAARLHMGARITNLAGTTAGLAVTVSAPLVEVTSSVQPFFDGLSPAYSDFTFGFTGTPNNSASVERGLSVPSTGSANTGVSTAAVIRSTEWSKSGVASLRISPRGTGKDTAAQVLGSSVSLGPFVPGNTYTASVVLRLPAPVTNTPFFNSNWGLSLFFTDSVRGWTAANPLRANATNTAGEQRLTLTFTVSTGATFATVRLYHGTNFGSGDSWWDDLVVVEGTASPNYFDGSTPGEFETVYAWTGTPNASTSTKTYTHFNPDVYGPGPDLYIPGPMVTVYPQPLSVGSRTAEAYLPSYTTSASKRGS